MSKSTSNKSRTIQIKPIEDYIDETNSSESNHETNIIFLRDEVSKKKQILERLRLEQTNLLQATEDSITEQRQAWETEKQNLIKSTRDKAYEDGFLEGKASGKREYEELISQINHLTKLAKKDHDKTVRRSEETIVQLAIAVAEKILNKKLNDNPGSFSSIVQSVLLQLKDSDSVDIYVHPIHYEYILNKKDEYHQLLRQDTNLQVFVNQNLEENDCIVEHTYGKVDASVETQLQQLEALLVELAMEKTL